jgi:hypothetical protein
MTAYELACDIINRSNSVQPCKYAPRGPMADAVVRFMGRAAGHETFITKPQADLFAKLLGSALIITAGEGSNKFAGFVKTIWSEAKQQNYYLLTFCGYVAQPEEVESAPTTTPVQSATVANPERANGFAALLIKGAIDKGFAKKDERAGADEDYLCTWLTKNQADALIAQLPTSALNASGHIVTQVVGSFCYWSKAKAASGAVLLCWMGEPTAPAPVASKPAPVVPAGKLIPMDPDIPF